MANTIILKGDPIRKEALAGGTITPGMLLAWSTGALIAHGSAAGTNVQVMVAVEEDFIGDDIDTDYASGSQVQYVVPKRGDELYMLLEAAANVAKGAALESNGAGALQAVSTGQVIAFAAEAKDNSAGLTAVRIKVEAA